MNIDINSLMLDLAYNMGKVRGLLSRSDVLKNLEECGIKEDQVKQLTSYLEDIASKAFYKHEK